MLHGLPNAAPAEPARLHGLVMDRTYRGSQPLGEGKSPSAWHDERGRDRSGETRIKAARVGHAQESVDKLGNRATIKARNNPAKVPSRSGVISTRYTPKGAPQGAFLLFTPSIMEQNPAIPILRLEA